MFSIKPLVSEVHQIAKDKGFYDNPVQNIPEKLCLIHSEVSEALEELRNPVVNVHAFSEELVDIIIRTCDLLGFMQVENVDEILNAKIEKNRNRPYLHGKQF